MAKLGDLSEDEKSLFSHLNKGKEIIWWLCSLDFVCFILIFFCILRQCSGSNEAFKFWQCQS